ncbi:hypothetical protein [Cohnella sp.]|uniref:hypothetical protein n=1 Tax=Cohnella sp. TaxID=1883426 RepID=UPI0035696C81
MNWNMERWNVDRKLEYLSHLIELRDSIKGNEDRDTLNGRIKRLTDSIEIDLGIEKKIDGRHSFAIPDTIVTLKAHEPSIVTNALRDRLDLINKQPHREDESRYREQIELLIRKFEGKVF